MPIEIACQTCSLRFSVGWYHYHSFETGYGSQIRLVCKNCGAQHAIEIALRDRGPEQFEHCDVVLTAAPDDERIAALKLIRNTFDCTPAEAKAKLATLPLVLKQRLLPSHLEEWRQQHDTSGLMIDYPVVDSEPNSVFGPLKKDRLLGASQPCFGSDNINLEELPMCMPLTEEGLIHLTIQSCSACSCVGTLTREFELNQACPHCGKNDLVEVSSWIT